MKLNKGTPRNIKATRECFLNAVESLLQKEGLRGLGINAIAREAGRDKALIYKYFGDLNGLYMEYAKKSRLFPTLKEMMGVSIDKILTMDPYQLTTALVKGYLREIRKRPLTLEILRWELVEQNSLTKALSTYRSQQTNQIKKYFKDTEAFDISALFSILYGGLVYLMLKAKAGEKFTGLDLNSEQTWNRIENAMETLLKKLLKR